MDEDKIIGRPYIYEAPSRPYAYEAPRDATFVAPPAITIIPPEERQRIIQEQDRLKKQKLFEDNQWIQQVFAAHPNARITGDFDEYGKPQVVYTDNYGIVRRVSENSLTPSDTTVTPTFSSFDPNSPEAKRREMYERELKRTDPEKWLLYYGTPEQRDNYLSNKAHFDVLANSAELASLAYGAASSAGRRLFGEGVRRLGQTGLGQTAKVVFNPYTIPGAVTTSAFTAPYLSDALTNGLNVENSIGIGLGVLPYAAPVITKAYNVGKTAVGSLQQTIDNARNYANYLSRVAAYNNRGRLNAGIPIPNFEVTEDVAKAALQKVTDNLASGKLVDPSDLRILSTDIGQTVVYNEGSDLVQNIVMNNLNHPKVKLLNKVYTGALDPSDMQAIVEDDQLLSKLPDDTRKALIDAYDDALYQNFANAADKAEAAKRILPKLKGEKYKTQISDELASTRPIVTEPTPEPTAVVVEASPTPTPEPAATGSATIDFTTQPAAPARPQTLAERWMEIYPDTYNIKFGRPGKKFRNQSEGYNTILDDNGNLVPDKIGFGGNTFTLKEQGGKPMISGQISSENLAEDLQEYVYNPKWYSISDQGADPNLGKVRKWFWKPAENLNAKVRTNQGDITVTGPGVDRTKLSNWALTLGGLGGVSFGVPMILGGIKSLFGGGDSDQPQRVVYDIDGTPHLIEDTHFTDDSLRATINNKLVSVGRISNGNFKVIPDSEAEKEDAYNAKQQATNQNSGPMTIKQNVDTLSIE